MSDLHTKITELKACVMQANQSGFNSKVIEIFESLSGAAPQASDDSSAVIADLTARLGEAETKLANFAPFDPDGDGKPGGKKVKKVLTETTPVEAKKTDE